MKTIGERIREIRRSLGMTQTEFAMRIGSVQNTVTGYENGRRNPSSAVITLICREFGINQQWLETGKGEMLIEPDDSLLINLAAKYSLNENDIMAIKSFLELPPEYRKGVIEWGKEFATRTALQLGVALHDESEEKPARKHDGELTREEMHAILDAELDARDAAIKRAKEMSSVSTIMRGSLKKFGNNY